MLYAPLGIAFLAALALIPLVRQLSIRYGYVAVPRADRWSPRPTATLGGIGIFIAFQASLLAGAALTGMWSQVPWGILAGSLIVFSLGLFDDFRHITPPAKLVGQILAAAVVVAFGYTTKFFTPKIANTLVAQLPNILLTFVWLVGITNAINLLDNMDGLAGGIAFIASAFLAYFFWRAHDPGLMLVALAMSGAVLGFLVFNWPPASIFMGDSGSLSLGFTLAALAIARQAQASNVFAVMGVPTLLFLLPILDTTFVTFTRLLRGQSPAQGGRDHTSHRLIAFGLSERQTLLVLYSIAVVSGVVGIGLEALSYWLSLIFVPLLVITLAILVAYLGRLKIVQAAQDSNGRNWAITRFMVEMTYRRRLLEVTLDFFLIGVAYYLAFLTQQGFFLDNATFGLFLQSLPVALGGAYLAFFALGVYRGVWRYVGLDDLLRFAEVSFLGSLFTVLGIFVFHRQDPYPPVLFVLFGVFLLLGLAASRSSFRVLDLFSGQQARVGEERVLICGAGDEGEMALRWILMNPQLEYRPVGFLDDDPFMFRRKIHGVEVLGNLNQIDVILAERQIQGMIVTAKALKDHELERKLVETCRKHQCWVRSLRLEFELLE
jgi:UDP-GlcNAc:undecaprenyl-phosphate/decaprenyl-phosphate GlcNAc-1-phosphate transferase